MRSTSRAFTLVEVLIVVVILGILAAVVVPHFTSATEDTAQRAASYEVKRLRKAVEVYQIRHDTLPDVAEGDRTWGGLIGGGDYLKTAPLNPWVGGDAAGVVVFGNGPDNAYQNNYGWIYDAATGRVWAGSFDADDNPLPKQ
jgi:general secretion pathway protein G